MKVRLLISRSGPDCTQKVGEEIDVTDAEAKRLMEASPPKAVPVREDRAVETTTGTAKRGRRKAAKE